MYCILTYLFSEEMAIALLCGVTLKILLQAKGNISHEFNQKLTISLVNILLLQSNLHHEFKKAS